MPKIPQPRRKPERLHIPQESGPPFGVYCRVTSAGEYIEGASGSKRIEQVQNTIIAALGGSALEPILVILSPREVTGDAKGPLKQPSRTEFLSIKKNLHQEIEPFTGKHSTDIFFTGQLHVLPDPFSCRGDKYVVAAAAVPKQTNPPLVNRLRRAARLAIPERGRLYMPESFELPTPYLPLVSFDKQPRDLPTIQDFGPIDFEPFEFVETQVVQL